MEDSKAGRSYTVDLPRHPELNTGNMTQKTKLHLLLKENLNMKSQSHLETLGIVAA